jgi:UDP-N-acetylmuramyl pentapeptide phosphotransferase/UDP-N-acetylglucosamine-1-phosphate transferase
VSLLEGPALAAGLVVGSALAGGRSGAAGALAAAGGAAFGLIDDLSEDTSRHRKGLRGHLGALAHGELTTGGLKVLGIGASSLAAAAVALPRPPSGRAASVAWWADVATSGALVAATANLVNLLDLRPGRALKAGMLAALPALGGAGAPAGAACLGASVAALGPDLQEQDMLGDGGANALGALVGTAVVLGAPRQLRLALLAGAVALTLASERVSFTQVIARTPVLRELDAWGRRPAAGTAAPGP